MHHVFLFFTLILIQHTHCDIIKNINTSKIAGVGYTQRVAFEYRSISDYSTGWMPLYSNTYGLMDSNNCINIDNLNNHEYLSITYVYNNMMYDNQYALNRDLSNLQNNEYAYTSINSTAAIKQFTYTRIVAENKESKNMMCCNTNGVYIVGIKYNNTEIGRLATMDDIEEIDAYNTSTIDSMFDNVDSEISKLRESITAAAGGDYVEYNNVINTSSNVDASLYEDDEVLSAKLIHKNYLSKERVNVTKDEDKAGDDFYVPTQKVVDDMILRRYTLLDNYNSNIDNLPKIYYDRYMEVSITIRDINDSNKFVDFVMHSTISEFVNHDKHMFYDTLHGRKIKIVISKTINYLIIQCNYMNDDGSEGEKIDAQHITINYIRLHK